jgi:phospholipid/cholesterol/gamma-HCH transport system substrate-binding protein
MIMSKELRLGIFIVVALVLFAAGVFWIGNRQFRFSSTYELNADFQNAAGLTEGAQVRVGGLQQGAVRRIVLPQRPDRKVRVEMDLRDATRRVVKKDSIASIRTEGLVGDQYVEISFGSTGSPSVSGGDTIGSEPPLELSNMLKKTSAILDSVQGAMESVDQAADNLKQISTKLNQGNGTMGALLNDRTVYNQIKETTANLQDDTEALKHNFLLRGFFKKRGYEDEGDLQRNAAERLPGVPPDKRFTYSASKIFEKSDSAKLKNAKSLDDAGHFLEQNRQDYVVIACYADQKGDTDKQHKLTEARSVAMRDYLVEHFKLDDTHVKTMGAGKTANAADGGEADILVYQIAVERSKAK